MTNQSALQSKQIFNSIDEVKHHFSIASNVSFGEASFDQFIIHPVLAHDSEDSLVSVQIGELTGSSITTDESVAVQADMLVKKLTHYFEHGDHDGLESLDLILMKDGYRLYGEVLDLGEIWKEEPFQLDTPSLQEIIDFIS